MKSEKFKICIFGDGGVGKTSLVNRYLTGVFQEHYKITIGADFFVKRINVNRTAVTLQVWDFAGEDRFKFILPSYISGSSGCIFMFDITRYSSIKNVTDWMEIFHKGSQNFDKEIPIIMVGGKLDLDHKRSVMSELAVEVAEKNNFYHYLECSSKTGQNINEIFESITKIMLERVT